MMSSPVEISLNTFVRLDRSKKEALFLQIAFQFINGVKRQLLPVDAQLPGSRKIAEQLKVHRKTVVAALAELQSQGWVEIIPNVGTFIRNPDGKVLRSKTGHPPQIASFSFNKEVILDLPSASKSGSLYFSHGTPDYRLINPREVHRSYFSVVERHQNLLNIENTSSESLFFKEQLSFYLNLNRGFHLSPSHLLPVPSQEQTHSILARLLLGDGALVLVEELSYFLPNMIYNQAGARIKTVPIDEEGIDVDYIRSRFAAGEINFVYVNSNAQYPTTITMSDARKKALLALAEEYNFIIIEDASDEEFLLSSQRKPSLFLQDGGQRVIYTGAIGAYLKADFRMHFLIGPEDFLLEARKYLNIFGKSNVMVENTLAALIYEGSIQRYQRKVKKSLNERQLCFSNALDRYFGKAIRYKLPSIGIAMWIEFKDPIPLKTLQKNAEALELSLSNLCLFQSQKICALRLGFGHLNPSEIVIAVKKLHQAFQNTPAFG